MNSKKEKGKRKREKTAQHTFKTQNKTKHKKQMIIIIHIITIPKSTTNIQIHHFKRTFM